MRWGIPGTIRSAVLLVVLALGGCTWTSPLTIPRPALDPAGPCLQIVRPWHHTLYLYKANQLVGANGYDTFLRAVADRPRSVRLLKNWRGLSRASIVLGVSGVALGFGLALSGAALQEQTPQTSLALFRSGFAVVPSSPLIGLILKAVAESLREDAIDEYNTAARRGCSPVDAGAAAQALGG